MENFPKNIEDEKPRKPIRVSFTGFIDDPRPDDGDFLGGDREPLSPLPNVGSGEIELPLSKSEAANQ